MEAKTWVSLVAILPLACAPTTKAPPSQGYIAVEGGRIWYQTMGSGVETPLLVIHGGPGNRSCGFLATLDPLAESRPVILYDQLGSGRSDRPSDTTLWNLPRFVDEVSRLREALQLEELHIMGHSWGASVAIEYMLTQTPSGVKSLVLAGPLISTTKWIEDANELRAQLPEPLQAVLTEGEDSGVYGDEYWAATDSFYARYLARSGWPLGEYPECEGSADFNVEVYEYMWGPTEFHATGSLGDFERSDRLKELDLPVLFVGGEYDEVRPETLRLFQRQVPGSLVEVIEDAGHMTMIDQKQAFNHAVGQFLHEVDGETPSAS